MLTGKDKKAGHSKKSEAMRESQVCQRVASRPAQHVEGRISMYVCKNCQKSWLLC